MSVNQGFDAGIREAEPMIVDDTPPDTAGEIVRPRLGADSLVWKFYGDSRGGILGFQRLAGTENCIEQLGQAVLDHSVIFSDFLGRAKRTGPPVMKTVYSTEPEKWGGRTVRDFHKDIKAPSATVRATTRSTRSCSTGRTRRSSIRSSSSPTPSSAG